MTDEKKQSESAASIQLEDVLSLQTKIIDSYFSKGAPSSTIVHPTIDSFANHQERKKLIEHINSLAKYIKDDTENCIENIKASQKNKKNILEKLTPTLESFLQQIIPLIALHNGSQLNKDIFENINQYRESRNKENSDPNSKSKLGEKETQTKNPSTLKGLPAVLNELFPKKEDENFGLEPLEELSKKIDDVKKSWVASQQFYVYQLRVHQLVEQGLLPALISLLTAMRSKGLIEKKQWETTQDWLEALNGKQIDKTSYLGPGITTMLGAASITGAAFFAPQIAAGTASIATALQLHLTLSAALVAGVATAGLAIGATLLVVGIAWALCRWQPLVTAEAKLSLLESCTGEKGSDLFQV